MPTSFEQSTLVEDLKALVCCESFSADHEALARSADLVAAMGTRLLGAAPEVIVIDGVPNLRWTFGQPRVLLLGHHDTVWPVGTLQRMPWTVAEGIIRGPGVVDMKAGLVMMFHALAAQPSLDGVCLLVNGDEELGSPGSRGLIEEAARACSAALVAESAADATGTVKIARKGNSRYDVLIEGRAAHAGLEPEKGVNAAIEAAHQTLAIAEIARSCGPGDPELGPATVTPTVLSAGSTRNTVPARASIAVDVRVGDAAAQDQIDAAMRALTARLPGASVRVEGGPARPPMPPESGRELFRLATETAAELGLPPLRGVAVGGVSDGNYTAGAGCPTLDGLGGVGGGAHADSEHVVLEYLVPRARLLAGLVSRLREGGGSPAEG